MCVHTQRGHRLVLHVFLYCSPPDFWGRISCGTQSSQLIKTSWPLSFRNSPSMVERLQIYATMPVASVFTSCVCACTNRVCMYVCMFTCGLSFSWAHVEVGSRSQTSSPLIRQLAEEMHCFFIPYVHMVLGNSTLETCPHFSSLFKVKSNKNIHNRNNANSQLCESVSKRLQVRCANNIWLLHKYPQSLLLPLSASLQLLLPLEPCMTLARGLEKSKDLSKAWSGGTQS